MRRTGAICLAITALLAVVPARAAAADRNHDRIFDDLDARLASGAGGRLPVVVTLGAPASAERVAGLEREAGHLAVTRRLHIVHAFQARATPSQIRALAALPGVVHIESDASAVPFGLAAQDAAGVTQARLDLPGLNGDGDGDPNAYSTRDMVAAVIDSGIDPTMPDLGAGKVIGFKDFVNNRTEPYDDLGHGSIVSAALAGSGASGPEGRGVAPGGALVGLKVVDANSQSSLGLIADAIQWAVDHRAEYGIRVINLSIGSPDPACPDGTDVASKAVDAAVDAGLVVIAAAGNSGPDACTVKAPAAARGALAVGALSDPAAGGFALSWFSSRGPTADGRIKPDVVAPALDVMEPHPGGGHAAVSGTSIAAPFAAGAALLLLDANPSLTPAQVKDAMISSAVDWGAPGPDAESGAGRLDVYAALRRAGAALATPPKVPSHVSWQGTDGMTRDLDVADADAPLALTLTGPAALGFDLLDASGNLIATAVPDVAYRPWPSRQKELTLKAPAPGRYSVRVRGTGAFVVDASGDMAAADTSPPAVTIDTLGPTLAGAAGSALSDFPGVVVHVRAGGIEVRRLGAVPILGRWSVDVASLLPDGAYDVVAEQGDAAGNRGSASASLRVGPTPTPTATAIAAVTPTPQPPPPAVMPAKPPRLTISVPRTALATALRRGLALRVACAGGSSVRLRATLGARPVAERGVPCADAVVVLKLDARPLRRLRRATLTLAASAGARKVTRHVKLS